MNYKTRNLIHAMFANNLQLIEGILLSSSKDKISSGWVHTTDLIFDFHKKKFNIIAGPFEDYEDCRCVRFIDSFLYLLNNLYPFYEENYTYNDIYDEMFNKFASLYRGSRNLEPFSVDIKEYFNIGNNISKKLESWP